MGPETVRGEVDVIASTQREGVNLLIGVT